MTKRKKIKLKPKEGPKEEVKNPLKSDCAEATEKSFDFGGLPSRNLKKNLGCG